MVKIEHLDLELLIPYVRNSRLHSEQQVAQIAGSIKEFGFTNPVLVDEANVIIAGHGRVLAAQRLGLEKVPCIRLDYLTEPQKRAYVIADNRLALAADWDHEMLSVEMKELKEHEFNLDLLGFDDSELTSILNEGWASDIKGIEQAGSHTDGIKKTIRVEVDAENNERASTLIRECLTAEGVSFELK
jgi:ParB-like chromosome segregation protein Spo0J